jgi:hypothetical protein
VTLKISIGNLPIYMHISSHKMVCAFLHVQGLYLNLFSDLDHILYELSNEEKSGICELLSYSIKGIYLACGYKDYNTDLLELKIR